MTEPATTPSRPDPATLSFEESRDALARVVHRLQEGTDSLQEALDLWEWGESLASRCEEFLAAATARVERVVGAEAGSGELGATPTRG